MKQKKDSFLINLGKEIRKQRQAQGLTIEQLANKSKTSSVLIIHLETGQITSIQLAKLQKITKALGLELSMQFF